MSKLFSIIFGIVIAYLCARYLAEPYTGLDLIITIIVAVFAMAIFYLLVESICRAALLVSGKPSVTDDEVNRAVDEFYRIYNATGKHDKKWSGFLIRNRIAVRETENGVVWRRLDK